MNAPTEDGNNLSSCGKFEQLPRRRKNVSSKVLSLRTFTREDSLQVDAAGSHYEELSQCDLKGLLSFCFRVDTFFLVLLPLREGVRTPFLVMILMLHAAPLQTYPLSFIYILFLFMLLPLHKPIICVVLYSDFSSSARYREL